MTFSVRFTRHAESDLVRLYDFILARDPNDFALAERALDAIRSAINNLGQSPFSYRRVSTSIAFVRELVIPFGTSGYVALFEIEKNDTVTVLAVRHQREDDYP